MRDTFLIPNTLLFLCLGFLSVALFYYIVKISVRNGIQQANAEILQSVGEIKKSVHEIEMVINKKEST